MVMIVSVIIIGLLIVGVASYAIRWHRERAKWAKIRENQLENLKRLKEKIEG